jgi:hypothetical protein
MKSKIIATIGKAVAILILFPGTFIAQAQTNSPVGPAPGASDAGGQSGFRVISRAKSNTIQINAGTVWSGYQRFELQSSIYQPTADCGCLSSHDITRLTDALDTKLKSTFKKEIAGDGMTLQIRPSITSVRLTNTPLNILSFLAIQAPISYGAASVRFDLIDEASGRKVGQITSVRHAWPWNLYPWDVLSSFQPTGHSMLILKRDAKRLKIDFAILASQPKSSTTQSSTGQTKPEAVAALK